MPKNKAKIPLVWDLTPLFKGDNDPQLKVEQARSIKISERFAKKWEPKTDWLKDPKILKKALDEHEDWLRNSGANSKVCYYWGLRSAQEQDNPKVKAREQQADDVAKKIANQMKFFALRLAKVDQATQKKFLSDPGLSIYHRVLKRLFEEAKYHLSEPEEKILTLTGQYASGNWAAMVSELLAKKELAVLDENGKKTKKPMSAVMPLLTSKNKKVRDEAAKAFNEHIKNYVDVAEHEINSLLGYKKVKDELRGYKRPDEARHINDDIETGVVDALVEAVSKRFDLAKKFYRLKAKILGQKQLAYHERNLSIGKFDKKITYEEVVKLVGSVFHDLDPEFGKIFDNFVSTGKVDVLPKRGKKDGAFCSHDLATMPIYILLNHNNRLRDATTLAHEAGHGINFELMKKQPPSYFFTSLATAEVASTFMEDFVLERIARDAQGEEKLKILMEKLNDDISTIPRQIALYRFELELHKNYREKGYLTKTEIGAMFRKHMSAYMGPAISQDPGSENWWVYWAHIRRFFYVYSYASGLLISKALQRMVRADKNKITLVKDFLSAGVSESPRDTFLKFGVDIADRKFWETGLAEIESNLKEAERLAKSLDKKKKRA